MNIASPEMLGFSSRRLERIGQAMRRYVDEKKLAGTLTLIARRGQVLHLETTGMADIEAGKPMREDTIFRIASMTKPIASAALLSTAGDYLRFAQMLLNRGELGGVRLLGRKTVEAMTCNHLPAGMHPFDEKAYGFGLGVNVLLDVGLAQTLGSAGKFGWGGADCTNFWVDPRQEIVGLFMAQFRPDKYYPVIADFRVLAYQALID
jgi:CubicO group peptidase (beta-lactamase class C family)